MADDVYVNGRSALHEGSCGKSMGAFPDVCLMPPPSPAGPIPTPLPNNTTSSELKEGAPSVLIEGDKIGIKTSHLKSSVGNEPSKPTGGNVVNHATKGKGYFRSFSFDVKAEGEGVVRHMDMNTQNHACEPAGTPPWMHIAKGGKVKPLDCTKKNQKPKCELSTYKPNKCPPNKTPHHIVPAHCFLKDGMRKINEAGKTIKIGKKRVKVTPKMKEDAAYSKKCKKYRSKRAPCVCATGASKAKIKKLQQDKMMKHQHGHIHLRIDHAEATCKKSEWNYGKAKEDGKDSVCEVMPWCDPACIEKALKEYHEDECKIDDTTQLNQETRSDEWVAEAGKLLKKLKSKVGH